MNEQFVCKVKGCAAATEGRVFNHSRHLINHYRLMHGSKELGQRQVEKQRRAIEAEARLAADQSVEDPFLESPTMVVEKFDETGALLPAESKPQPVANLIDNLEQFLQDRIDQISAKMQSAQSRLEQAQSEVATLQSELTRVLAARKAYAMVVDTDVKSRTAGDTPDEYA